MLATINHTEISQLVVDHPESVDVLERFGIDYACGGAKSLHQACHERGIDTDLVLQELQRADHAAVLDNRDWTHVPLEELVQHIVRVHHGYLKSELPRLEMLTRRIASIYGRREPELVRVRSIFAAFKDEVEKHMAEEERVLFPAILELQQKRERARIGRNTLVTCIRAMTIDHNEKTDAMEQMRKLTRGYLAPAWACCNYRAMLHGLEHLEKALHRHMHLENNILFRRAIPSDLQ